MDFVAQAAIAAIERRDWDELKPLLHPYLHWTDRDGNTLRGRKSVLKKLADERPTEPPAFHELRDGQIYRWTEQLRPG
jgi:hypothetical protein